MTVVALIAIASLNLAFKHAPPYHGLEHVTHWFLLLCVSALVVRAHWWTSIVSTLGMIVLVLHWTLVSIGVRDPPCHRNNALHDSLCYVALPILAVAIAVSTGSFRAPLSRTISGLFVLIAVYTATLEAHERSRPGHPAYPGLPLPPLAMSAIGFAFGAAFLGAMRRATNLHTRFLSFEW